jgi:RNA polymerase sigma factor (sigma-70 family)
MVDILSRYRKTSERLTQKLGRRPTSGEIAHAMKMPVKKVREIEQILLQPASLDAPVLEEEDSTEYINLIEQRQASSARDELAAFLAQEQVADLLNRLTDREREVLRFRYGLKDGVTYTLGETAKHLGITRERVRQIQSSAERKLHLFLAEQEKASA